MATGQAEARTGGEEPQRRRVQEHVQHQQHMAMAVKRKAAAAPVEYMCAKRRAAVDLQTGAASGLVALLSKSNKNTKRGPQLSLPGLVLEILARGTSVPPESSSAAAKVVAKESPPPLELQQGAEIRIHVPECALRVQRRKLAELEGKVRSCQAEMKAVDAQRKTNQRQRAVYFKERRRYEDMEDKVLRVLSEGASSSKAEAKRLASKLARDLERLGADPSLLASAPQAFLKGPEQRTAFDKMVIDSMRFLLQDRLSTLDAALQANQAGGAELAALAGKQRAKAEAACKVRDSTVRELQWVRTMRDERRAAQGAYTEQAAQEALRAALRKISGTEAGEGSEDDSVQFLLQVTATLKIMGSHTQAEQREATLQ